MKARIKKARHKGKVDSPGKLSFSAELTAMASVETDQVLDRLGTGLNGLSEAEAASRLKICGLNEVALEKPQSVFSRLLNNLKNPLVILLAVLALVSFLTGDKRATAVMVSMIALGVVLRFCQEYRADNAAAKLKAMVSNKVTVIREGLEKEIPLKMVVPGDIICLAAGDMVPADARILSAKDLFLNQAALTGESLPMEKRTGTVSKDVQSPLDLDNLCFMGSNVESGTGLAVAIHTGARTLFGYLAASVVEQRELTSFDRGINSFTWMMIRFMAVMVPLVFLVNGISKHDWLEAFLFALAVAVGLTPEMMPMIVSVNLSKGALMMARKKVIVRRLSSIQNFGAMDILCIDKTGTITQGSVVLEKHINVHGEPSDRVLRYGYLNSYYHTGLKNQMDEAILRYCESEACFGSDGKYRKIDEIPFDFVRRRMSVILEDETGLNILICKGAVEEIVGCCSRVEIDEVLPMLPEHKARALKIVDDLSSRGFRILAVAYKELADAPDEPVYQTKDESDLILLGFLCFFDPPKESVPQALERLKALNVEVKVLTGDAEAVAAFICSKVGIPTDRILVGPQISAMDAAELNRAVNTFSIFAKLVPDQKQRIVKALQSHGHVVGFLGDGVNDAPALKAADVGISVDTAVDIAKESSDIILLDKDLDVLEQGVMEGRRVFGNIIKYIKMAASSNFGNTLSVVGASAFLPFLPMLPIQVLTANLLYDFSQTTIPADGVDSDWLKKPQQWKMDDILKFILFIGPTSSVFDYVTFFIMLYLFDCWNNAALFHTGWFVESVFTQTLIVHVIRTNRIPFIESRARWPLIVSSLVIAATAALLPVSPLSDTLGFVPLPYGYWPLLAAILIGYICLTQVVKGWFVRRFG